VSAMRERMQALLRKLLGGYSIYRIFTAGSAAAARALPADGEFRFTEVERDLVAASTDPLLSDCARYHGADCRAFALTLREVPVALCYFWYGERYKTRNFWPLREREAKLVQVVTSPRHRRKGAATALIARASSEMFASGFERLYARVWHSHAVSVLTFEKAGWEQCAAVIEVNPFRRKKPYRLTVPVARPRRHAEGPAPRRVREPSLPG